MRFIATADSRIGAAKQNNQDSVIIKHAAYEGGEVLMAIVCDGMGGLSKGEVASASVIQRFSEWFDEDLPADLTNLKMSVIGGKWVSLLKDLNEKLLAHSKRQGISMGTTFSGILLVNDMLLVAHVGDSRVYQISSGIVQLTNDQTFVAREVEFGAMSREQARTDSRRSLLLQCVGASEDGIEPQLLVGKAVPGVYLLCSDGLYHELSEQEMYKTLHPARLDDKETMHETAGSLIDLVKKRNEQDDVSVVLVRVR